MRPRQPAACGQCFPCQDGRPEDCENPAEPDRPGKREEPVVSWRAPAQAADEDVSAPRVRGEPQPSTPAGWLRGRRLPARRRWLCRGSPPGLAAGRPATPHSTPISRRVTRSRSGLAGGSRTTAGHSASSTASTGRDVSSWPKPAAVRRRPGGAPGDRRQPGPGKHYFAGLPRRARSSANVTVVPARAEGTVTITLLELLHQHWAKAQDGRGAEYHVLDKTRRNAT